MRFQANSGGTGALPRGAEHDGRQQSALGLEHAGGEAPQKIGPTDASLRQIWPRSYNLVDQMHGCAAGGTDFSPALMNRWPYMPGSASAAAGRGGC
jgi:hypothetical protein